jgi:hypothetical protein
VDVAAGTGGAEVSAEAGEAGVKTEAPPEAGAAALAEALAPPSGAGTVTAPEASCCARLSANLSIRREPTSVITPRPNCAGRPVTLSVVCSVTTVAPAGLEPFSGRSAARTVAEAVPAPRISLPDASTRTERSDSSRFLNEAVPL